MTRVSEWRVRALYVARRVLFLLCARRDALIGDDLDCFVGNRVGEESRVGSAHLCACLEGSFSALLLFTAGSRRRWLRTEKKHRFVSVPRFGTDCDAAVRPLRAQPGQYPRQC